MTSNIYRGALMLVALGALVSVPELNAKSSPAGNVSDAIKHAKELVTHAEKSVKYAEMGGKNRHLVEGLSIWKKPLSMVKRATPRTPRRMPKLV